jgi:hypothetical protein
MEQGLICVAHGRAGEWEAFCLDYDLAVQGRSFEEVKEFLNRAIDMYFEAARSEPEPIRSRLLGRKAPFFVWLGWALRVFWSTLFRATHRGSNLATVEFIACPA